jgi:hypothetical protein
MRIRPGRLVLLALAALGAFGARRALAAATVSRPAAAVEGAIGFELPYAMPVGGFGRTADPTLAFSMWVAAMPGDSRFGIRGEFHVAEEHLVADDVPNPFFVPAAGARRLPVPLYTDVAGLSLGPILRTTLWKVPVFIHATLGADDIEPSEGITSGGPATFGGHAGAPGGWALSWSVGTAMLFERRFRDGNVGGVVLGVDYFGHPNASYLDRPPTAAAAGDTSRFRGARGSADMLRIRLGLEGRFHVGGGTQRQDLSHAPGRGAHSCNLPEVPAPETSLPFRT